MNTINRSFAKENMPPNIIPNKNSQISHLKQLQQPSGSASKKSIQANIRSKTPPDLHYAQIGYAAAALANNPNKQYLNTTSNCEELKSKHNISNNQTSFLYTTFVDDQCSSMQKSNGNYIPKMQSAHKQHLSGELVRRNREKLGYLNIAAQENSENLRKISKIGPPDNISDLLVNNYCDNPRESMLEGGTSRRKGGNSVKII